MNNLRVRFGLNNTNSVIIIKNIQGRVKKWDSTQFIRLELGT